MGPIRYLEAIRNVFVLIFGVKSIRFFAVMFCLSNGSGFVGNGCVGEYYSPGTSSIGTGCFFDWLNGFISDAIEYVCPCLFRDLSDSFNGSFVYGDVNEHWCGGYILIPDAVVYKLKMLHTFFGRCVEGDKVLSK